jgi:hypothetical protein
MNPVTTGVYLGFEQLLFGQSCQLPVDAFPIRPLLEGLSEVSESWPCEHFAGPHEQVKKFFGLGFHSAKLKWESAQCKYKWLSRTRQPFVMRFVAEWFSVAEIEQEPSGTVALPPHSFVPPGVF